LAELDGHLETAIPYSSLLGHWLNHWALV